MLMVRLSSAASRILVTDRQPPSSSVGREIYHHYTEKFRKISRWPQQLSHSASPVLPENEQYAVGNGVITMLSMLHRYPS